MSYPQCVIMPQVGEHMDWLPAIVSSALSGVVTSLVVIWKSSMTAYGGEKGKNLARKEDIDKIVNEIEKVTRTQKQIKTDLAGDLWNKQMLWTEKKLVYGGMLMAIHDMLTHVNEMRACANTIRTG